MRSILVTIALIISTLLFAPTANAQPGCTRTNHPGTGRPHHHRVVFPAGAHRPAYAL